MRRRDFIAALGGAAAMPLAARAQQQPMPVVGFLRSTSAANSAHLVNAFRAGLNEAGFMEGQNVTIEYRWADDRIAQLPALVADLVQRQVAVIVGNTPASQAAIKANTASPVVFASGSDPMRQGLVTSLNRPGGNVTGVVFTTADVTAKRLGLLCDMVPKAAVVAVLADPNWLEIEVAAKEALAAGAALGRKVLVVRASSERQLRDAFQILIQGGAGALLVGGGPAFLNQRRQLVTLIASHSLPACYVSREYAEAGGLMSYGASQTQAYRRAGSYVARILRGEKAGNLPVELVSKFELAINLTTAKALGLSVPTSMQLLADEVIE